MTGFGGFLLIFVFSATTALASDIQKPNPSYENASQNAILLAKKSSDEPKKNVPTYQKLMKDLTDQLFAVIESIDKSDLSREEKWLKVHQFIMSVRFGPEMKDTFFAMTIQGLVKSDVYQPDLTNKDLSEMKDSTGLLFIAEMIRLSRETGGGFVQHLWPKHDGKLPVPTISYVRIFKKWNMIYGTRIFLSDLEAYESVDPVSFPLAIQPFGQFFHSGNTLGE